MAGKSPRKLLHNTFDFRLLRKQKNNRRRQDIRSDSSIIDLIFHSLHIHIFRLNVTNIPPQIPHINWNTLNEAILAQRQTQSNASEGQNGSESRSEREMYGSSESESQSGSGSWDSDSESGSGSSDSESDNESESEIESDSESDNQYPPLIVNRPPLIQLGSSGLCNRLLKRKQFVRRTPKQIHEDGSEIWDLT